MNPELAKNTEASLHADLAALDVRRAEFQGNFPGGPEAHIAQYRNWLRTELTYTSNAIEGNTLSSVETRMVIEDDAVIPDKSLREHLEARDHAIAWDYATDVLEPKPQLDPSDLLALHQRVLYSISNPEAGVLRRGGIRVAGSRTVFPNPLKVPALVDQLMIDVHDRLSDIHPVLHAAHMHLDLVKIHPFTDGNGRTGRILMNLLLRRSNYLAVPIYPSDRRDYLNAIEQADTDGGDAFCRLIVNLEKATIDELLAGA